MKEMLKRIFLVAFIFLVLVAISGFFYMQKHPMEGKKATGKSLNLSGQVSK
ncbi:MULTISPECIES: hypothetical protein [Chryseobacterium]|jgi:cytochrome c-type biogenesis protein CcmE|uniref:Cytochrome c-type biogenesis protein CcmE n=1 Tax=Chryseobacterium geocarposphaerae TaxID=1416776 RepID=A0ABU1LDK8_9FLAO|nr:MULTISPECIES: hypothetical protein [Chryseobacterium]MDR6404815.1 cytochrome c-type biogenesis protein CcmE [Chryseobacterium geocarposphaerae]MDR6697953.1 cytochrome c-type biogenesis protein CcmE [Chryseobacterium ginsenosidimutans]